MWLTQITLGDLWFIQYDNECLTALDQRCLHRKIVRLYSNLPCLHSNMSIHLHYLDHCLFYHLK